jgi:hypothetical protein
MIFTVHVSSCRHWCSPVNQWDGYARPIIGGGVRDSGKEIDSKVKQVVVNLISSLAIVSHIFVPTQRFPFEISVY